MSDSEIATLKLFEGLTLSGGNNDVEQKNNNEGNYPYGGCLPIIMCYKKDIVKNENNNREFIKIGSPISITQIMNKRRDNKDLFT